jgi:hypothetical protein
MPLCSNTSIVTRWSSRPVAAVSRGCGAGSPAKITAGAGPAVGGSQRRERQRQAEAVAAVPVIHPGQESDRNANGGARRDVRQPGLELIRPLLFDQRRQPAVRFGALVLAARFGFLLDLALDQAVVRLDAQAVDGRAGRQREPVGGLAPGGPVVPEDLSDLDAGRQAGDLDADVRVQGDRPVSTFRRPHFDSPEGLRTVRGLGGLDSQDQQQHQAGRQHEQQPVLPGQRLPPAQRPLLDVAPCETVVIAPDGPFELIADRWMSRHASGSVSCAGPEIGPDWTPLERCAVPWAWTAMTKRWRNSGKPVAVTPWRGAADSPAPARTVSWRRINQAAAAGRSHGATHRDRGGRSRDPSQLRGRATPLRLPGFRLRGP